MFSEFRFGPGDALINVQACLPELESLAGSGFDALYFLDLCAGIEAAILHPTLYYADPGIPAAGSIARKLYDEGILKQWEVSTDDPMEAARQIIDSPSASSLMGVLPDVVAENEQQEFARLVANAQVFLVDLAIEDSTGIPIIPSRHLAPAYLRLADVRTGQVAQAVAQTSLADISSDLKTLLLAKRMKGTNLQFIPMPPLAFEVLCRAGNASSVADVVLEVRDEFAKVRNYFAELDRIYSSENATMSEQMKAHDRIAKSMVSLIGSLKLQTEIRNLPVSWKLITDLSSVVSAEKLFDGAEVNDVSIGKALGLAIAGAPKAYWRWRVRVLHGVGAHFMDATNQQYAGAIARNFEVELSSVSLASVHKYDGYVSAAIAEFA